MQFLYKIVGIRNGTLVYCGPNKGESLIKIFYKYEKIYCFEANPEIYSYLIYKFNRTDINFFNYAIGNKNQEVILNLYKEDSTNASVGNIFNKDADILRKITVKMKKLSDILSELNISYIDLYLSDIEGNDFTALKSLNSSMISQKKIKYIQVECCKNGIKNPYINLTNYEKNFDNLLSNNYIKIASGFGKLTPGIFNSQPTSYRFKDVLYKVKD